MSEEGDTSEDSLEEDDNLGGHGLSGQDLGSNPLIIRDVDDLEEVEDETGLLNPDHHDEQQPMIHEGLDYVDSDGESYFCIF